MNSPREERPRSRSMRSSVRGSSMAEK
jgi:hypothetical protein